MNAPAETTYRRNPLLRVRIGDPFVCDLLLEGRSFELPNAAIVAAIAALTGVATAAEHGRRLEELLDEPAIAAAAVSAFVAAGILIDSSVHYPEMAAAEHWIERGWTDALIFHLRARATSFDDDGVSNASDLHDSVLRPLIGDLGLWKEYPDHPQIALPPPTPRDNLPRLADILLKRRSNQPWKRSSISAADLGTVLALASEETVGLRTQAEQQSVQRPSSYLNSAFSALELYVAAFAVEGLEAGLYHYDPRRHGLALLRLDDLRDEFVSMCAGQARAGSGAATIVVSAVWERYMRRYGHPHAYRVLLINAAELAQKLLIGATALDMSTFVTPAFDERRAADVLGLEFGVETPIEAVGVG